MGYEFDGLSCETRIDLICHRFNIKKNIYHVELFFKANLYFYQSSKIIVRPAKLTRSYRDKKKIV